MKQRAVAEIRRNLIGRMGAELGQRLSICDVNQVAIRLMSCVDGSKISQLSNQKFRPLPIKKARAGLNPACPPKLRRRYETR